MIADDTALLRQGLARLLGEAGIDVCGEAGDGESLLRLVEQERPDVAIVDIRMGSARISVYLTGSSDGVVTIAA